MADITIDVDFEEKPPRYEDINRVQDPPKHKDQGQVKLELTQSPPVPAGLKATPPGANNQKDPTKDQKRPTKPVREVKIECGMCLAATKKSNLKIKSKPKPKLPKDCTITIRQEADDEDLPRVCRIAVYCLYYFLVIYSIGVIVVLSFHAIDHRIG